MKRNTLTVLAAALLIAACGQNQVGTTSAQAAGKTAIGAGSANGKTDASVEQTIRGKLEKAYAEQQIKVLSVHPTPLDNLYEVVLSGKTVIYTDAKGDYMIVGDFIDIKNRKSLTDERTAQLSAVEYDSLPFDMAIKEVRGNGKLQVAVFSDPDCPYCKRLEHEFAKMTDITIYNFMMPLTGLHPDGARKAQQIWCQPDRTAAWTKWMREGKMPPQVPVCDNPVNETLSMKPLRWANSSASTALRPSSSPTAAHKPVIRRCRNWKKISKTIRNKLKSIQRPSENLKLGF